MQGRAPGAASISVSSERTIKKSGASSEDRRYHLSSREVGGHAEAPWLGMILGHWGGRENRNHWRRDALPVENGSRSRHATLLANMALLLRSAMLQVMAPERGEPVAAAIARGNPLHPARCLALLKES